MDKTPSKNMEKKVSFSTSEDLVDFKKIDEQQSSRYVFTAEDFTVIAKDETDANFLKKKVSFSTSEDLVDSKKIDEQQTPRCVFTEEHFSVKAKDETDANLLKYLYSPKTEVYLPTPVDAEEYNMDHPHRGLAVIFNQRSFIERLNVNERKGTDVDRDELHKTFLQLGFEENQILVHDDLTAEEIKDKLNEIADMDHSTHDCLIVTICTHGLDGWLYANDKKFPNDNLWKPFLGENCGTLAGKPKIFFIQACKDDLKQPRLTEHDASKHQRIPSYSDFLIVYSTVPGYFTWEESKEEGCLFVQSLCYVILRLHEHHHLMNMLTVVNKKVAFDLKKNKHYKPEDAHLHMPCVTSMLTRRIFFPPKERKEEDV